MDVRHLQRITVSCCGVSSTTVLPDVTVEKETSTLRLNQCAGTVIRFTDCKLREKNVQFFLSALLDSSDV